MNTEEESIDHAIDNLCAEFGNSILHERLEEISDDLDKIIQFEQYSAQYIHIDYIQFATYLHNKHVYYHAQLSRLYYDDDDAEDKKLFQMLTMLVTQPYSPMDYIKHTKEWYLGLLEYLDDE